MRFLADANIPGRAVTELRALGHDVVYAVEDDPNEEDANLLARAMREGRVLITLDTDFGDLVYLHGMPASCGVVLFRIARMPAAERPAFIVNALTLTGEWRGYFSVIDERNVRKRRAPGA